MKAAVPNPVCWDGRRARGSGEPIPSVSIQHWLCLSGIHHPISSISTVPLSVTSATAAKAAVMVPTPSSPSLPGARGSQSGHIPPSFCPCQGVFCRLWPPARGRGRGSVSITVGSWQGWRVPTLLPSGSVPQSSFTSCLGPWEKEERDEQELGLCQGGQCGEKHTKTTGKNTMYIKKVPVMD